MQYASEQVQIFARQHVFCSIKNFHDAQDILSDCLVCFIETKHTYKDKSQNELDLIQKTAVRNKVRDYIRKQQVRSKELLPSALWYSKEYTEIPRNIILSKQCISDIYSRLHGRPREILRSVYIAIGIFSGKNTSPVSRKTRSRYMLRIKKEIHLQMETGRRGANTACLPVAHHRSPRIGGQL